MFPLPFSNTHVTHSVCSFYLARISSTKQIKICTKKRRWKINEKLKKEIIRETPACTSVIGVDVGDASGQSEPDFRIPIRSTPHHPLGSHSIPDPWRVPQQHPTCCRRFFIIACMLFLRRCSCCPSHTLAQFLI